MPLLGFWGFYQGRVFVLGFNVGFNVYTLHKLQISNTNLGYFSSNKVEASIINQTTLLDFKRKDFLSMYIRV